MTTQRLPSDVVHQRSLNTLSVGETNGLDIVYNSPYVVIALPYHKSIASKLEANRSLALPHKRQNLGDIVHYRHGRGARSVAGKVIVQNNTLGDARGVGC